MRFLPLFVLMLPLTASVVLDRIAVIVGAHQVVKHSDIERDIRLTEYLNGEKLDLGPAARKAASNRLIDQAIIRQEMELGRYPEAEDAEVEKLLKDTLQSHPPPKDYGLNEDQVRRALKWQLTVLRFIDIRFRPRPETTADTDPFVSWLDSTRKATQIQYREEGLQ